MSALLLRCRVNILLCRRYRESPLRCRHTAPPRFHDRPPSRRSGFYAAQRFFKREGNASHVKSAFPNTTSNGSPSPLSKRRCPSNSARCTKSSFAGTISHAPHQTEHAAVLHNGILSLAASRCYHYSNQQYYIKCILSCYIGFTYLPWEMYPPR